MNGVRSRLLKLFALTLTLLASTWRFRIEGTMPLPPGIVAFWHGSMLPVWWVFRTCKPAALVSHSKDGDYLTSVLQHWGYVVFRGSSSKGGGEALQTLVTLAASKLVLITPDGPRGPRIQAKPGAIVASQRAHVPVTPIRVSVKRCYTFRKSWDRFILPLPWSRITVKVGESIHVPASASRTDVEHYIHVLTKEL